MSYHSFPVLRSVSSALIVETARSWIGTRFHHQGRVKAAADHKGGVDCLGLLVGVAQELALRDPASGKLLVEFDEVHYSRLPDGGALHDKLLRYLTEIPLADIAPGDVALFRLENNPQHLAILSNNFQGGLGMIHAYAQARQVVEHRLDETWHARLAAAFAFRDW